MFFTGHDLGESVRANELARFVTSNAVDTVDRYRAALDDVQQSQRALNGRLRDRRSAVASLRKQKAAAQAELARLVAAQRALAAKASRGRRGGPVAARAAGVIASGTWICPVQGPHAFSNDFGNPRSGPPAHRHQGNDIIAPRGTPVVASVSGSVSRNSSRLGGMSYFLHGSDGITYFGAHLSGYAASGQVAAGTVIGYVGNTGNASGGVNHLHFEMHPGGGGAVNPYPTLVKYC
jgi:murein DD-endopeptidase MepM/ murein hydrolase activator NlpD